MIKLRDLIVLTAVIPYSLIAAVFHGLATKTNRCDEDSRVVLAIFWPLTVPLLAFFCLLEGISSWVAKERPAIKKAKLPRAKAFDTKGRP